MSIDRGRKKMWYMFMMEYYSAIKNEVICKNMDGARNHYTK